MRTFNIEKNETQCVVTWRHYNSDVFVGFFILAVLAFGIAWFTQLPLWGLTILFLVLAVHIWSGKTKIVLGTDGFHSTYTNLIRKREQWFDLADIRHFEKRMVSFRTDTYSLRVDWEGGKATFHLPPKVLPSDLDDLCEQLNDFLEMLKASRDPGTITPAQLLQTIRDHWQVENCLHCLPIAQLGLRAPTACPFPVYL